MVELIYKTVMAACRMEYMSYCLRCVVREGNYSLQKYNLYIIRLVAGLLSNAYNDVSDAY